MTGSLIQAVGLSKRYGATVALSGLDWAVEPGSITGVLGPNGAGKTTLAKLVLGVTLPSAGSVSVLGKDVCTHAGEARQAVGFLPEERVPYGDMQPGVFLRYYGSFFPGFDPAAAASFLEAWGVPRSSRIRNLSKGNRAKLGLAAVLARKPRILLLDEPTIDLDPASAEEVLSLVVSWVADGERGVVMATHRLENAERICDSVLFLNEGVALAQGDLDDLRGRWKRVTAAGTFPPTAEMAQWPGVRSVSRGEGWVDVVVDRDGDEVVRRLKELGATTVEAEGVALRDVYLTLMDYRRGRLDGVLESLV